MLHVDVYRQFADIHTLNNDDRRCEYDFLASDGGGPRGSDRVNSHTRAGNAASQGRFSGGLEDREGVMDDHCWTFRSDSSHVELSPVLEESPRGLHHLRDIPPYIERISRSRPQHSWGLRNKGNEYPMNRNIGEFRYRRHAKNNSSQRLKSTLIRTD